MTGKEVALAGMVNSEQQGRLKPMTGKIPGSPLNTTLSIGVRSAHCAVRMHSRKAAMKNVIVSLKDAGCSKKRTTWFILMITSVNMDQF